jgi:hypothetical protein
MKNKFIRQRTQQEHQNNTENNEIMKTMTINMYKNTVRLLSNFHAYDINHGSRIHKSNPGSMVYA